MQFNMAVLDTDIV